MALRLMGTGLGLGPGQLQVRGTSVNVQAGESVASCPHLHGSKCNPHQPQGIAPLRLVGSELGIEPGQLQLRKTSASVRHQALEAGGNWVGLLQVGTRQQTVPRPIHTAVPTRDVQRHGSTSSLLHCSALRHSRTCLVGRFCEARNPWHNAHKPRCATRHQATNLTAVGETQHLVAWLSFGCQPYQQSMHDCLAATMIGDTHAWMGRSDARPAQLSTSCWCSGMRCCDAGSPMMARFQARRSHFGQVEARIS